MNRVANGNHSLPPFISRLEKVGISSVRVEVASALLTFEKKPFFLISCPCLESSSMSLDSNRETVEAIIVPVLTGLAPGDKWIKFKRLAEAPAEERGMALAKFE